MNGGLRPFNDLEKVNMEQIVEQADKAGKLFARKIKINQIRRFLDGVRRIENRLKGESDFNTVKDQVVLLRPMLAYAAGRDNRNDMKELMNFLDPAIKSGSRSKDNFKKLLRLIEGIVAYHRFYGGGN